MSEVKLSDIFLSGGIKDFGSALRKAVREGEDYASLVELEYVETPEEFAETLKKFLRRYESYAKRYERKRPEEKSLDEVVNLIDKYGVRLVRAALIAHALVKSSKLGDVEEIEGGK
ncbi:MAG: hypothetical protein QMC80_03540 [Thermoplasmatales archaeon]|nr:hypothetical protein [Thermoplasmatales archaeon]